MNAFSKGTLGTKFFTMLDMHLPVPAAVEATICHNLWMLFVCFLWILCSVANSGFRQELTVVGLLLLLELSFSSRRSGCPENQQKPTKTYTQRHRDRQVLPTKPTFLSFYRTWHGMICECTRHNLNCTWLTSHGVWP